MANSIFRIWHCESEIHESHVFNDANITLSDYTHSDLFLLLRLKSKR
jgi:hypothetical protein